MMSYNRAGFETICNLQRETMQKSIVSLRVVGPCSVLDLDEESGDLLWNLSGFRCSKQISITKVNQLALQYDSVLSSLLELKMSSDNQNF